MYDFKFGLLIKWYHANLTKDATRKLAQLHKKGVIKKRDKI